MMGKLFGSVIQMICNDIQLIKEQKMTETLFEIAPFNKPAIDYGHQKQDSYLAMLQQFCQTSYGLYSELFIKKIVSDAFNQHDHLIQFSLKKSIRQCARKFMLNDLQIVFLAYYCNKNKWATSFQQPILRNFRSQELTQQQLEQKSLQLFLDFNAYFIKSYIGKSQQFQSIRNYLSQIFPNFEQLYQKWIVSKPKQIFTITPRKLNEIYGEYARSSQIVSHKKNYNQLVDTLIQLSTTYSIIPNKKTNKKQAVRIKRNPRREEEEDYAGDNRNARKTRKNSEIFRIMQRQEKMEQSQMPNYGQSNYNVLNSNSNRPKRKSSLFFSSLQSLSKKSQQLVNQNKKKQESVEKKDQEIILERSRDKKPGNKISLNFKRKQKEKPNETVLGFLNQPSVIEFQKQVEEPKQQSRRVDYRSILNQSFRQPNMSFINLRSNRSSRSNSQLPFLWKPSQDSFFQKSKLS